MSKSLPANAIRIPATLAAMLTAICGGGGKQTRFPSNRPASARKVFMRSVFSATAALVVGGGVFFAAPAGATTLMAVFTGTFDYIDVEADSGQEGDQNIPFTITALYDPSLGGETATTPPGYETISGGTFTGYLSPILSFTVTAPGLNLTFPGDQNGLIRVSDTGSYFELASGYTDSDDHSHGFLLSFSSPNLTADPDQTFVSSPGESGDGYFEAEPLYVDPSLQAHSLVITAVPEPATWVMFLAGFGAVGFMLRRSLRKIAAAVA
jgi:PEP-CTERM motif